MPFSCGIGAHALRERGFSVSINPISKYRIVASVLISKGSDIVTVSKMLGHAKVSTTEDIYSHVIEESKQLASNLLADVFFRGKAGKIAAVPSQSP